MKVVLLAPVPDHVASGGIGIWTGKMIKNSPINGWEVKVVKENHIGKRETYGKNAKRNYFQEIKRCIIIWKNLRLAVKDKEVLIVQSCIPAAFLSMLREYVCSLIAKIYRKKYIVHFHCTVPDFAKGKKEQILLKLLSKNTDAFIVLNCKSKQFIKMHCNNKVVVIPNYVEEREVANNKKINSDLKTVVYTGGISKDKGCFEMFKIAKHHPELTFVLIGEYDTTILDHIKENKNIILTGVLEHDAVIDQLKEADLFMFLSHSEGFSLSLLEALSCGLPAIATNVGANKDMIGTDGGVIVNVNSLSDVENALKEVESYSVRKKMSENNTLKVLSQYTSKHVLPLYSSVYNKIIFEEKR